MLRLYKQTIRMILLETQEQFEQLWFLQPQQQPIAGMRPTDRAWIVWFSAAWCNPCKRLDATRIEAAAAAKGIPIWKCDDTINNYTGGYCGVRAIPTFIFMRPKQIQTKITNSDTDTVIQWIQSLP